MSQATLYYEDASGNWSLLPDWARFFLHLGNVLARRGSDEPRLVVGLAVPSRAYAAALLTTGIVCGRSHIPNTQAQLDAHFAQLRALPLGAPLIYRRLGKKRLKAAFAGVEMIDGEERIKVRTDRDSSSAWFLTPKLAQYIDIDSATHRSMHLPNQHSGRAIQGPSQLASDLLGSEIANTIATVSRLECVIIGSVARLRDEIHTARFATGTAQPGSREVTQPTLGCDQHGQTYLNKHSGNLQDILRAARFLPNGEAFRSDILTSQTAQPRHTFPENPTVVVYDGARSYLRARDEWRRSHWIVVLDKTEADFSDAVLAFDQDFLKFRSEAGHQPQIGNVPRGIDVAPYEEAQQ